MCMCVYVMVIVIVDGEWGIEMGIWGGGEGWESQELAGIGGNWRRSDGLGLTLRGFKRL